MLPDRPAGSVVTNVTVSPRELTVHLAFCVHVVTVHFEFVKPQDHILWLVP